MLALVASSLSTATVPLMGSAALSGQAGQSDAWENYKVRLEVLARQQGVRDSTIRANVPGLTLNQRVIDLERTEPVARTSGGVVGALAPYLNAHVTGSLIRRGRDNYSENYASLRAIEARYGVSSEERRVGKERRGGWWLPPCTNIWTAVRSSHLQ